ncbi:MAG TPA: AAA family ATPase [Shinella sp.]|uniref:AAA family ATPase n=1 Tax=Shinella sp. TaxID=1870904 RepID=UPI002E12229B|nr:AAA family ATPase [Shinella sp.]
MTALMQPESDPRPHQTAFREISSIAQWKLAGDVVLVPDPYNIDGVTRDDLTKISHWSDITEADIPRLAVLTDSFFRFIDEGEDASIVTIWREGTPLVRQIDGAPCEAAVNLIMGAITAQEALTEKWVGLPPLEAEIEKLAYLKGYSAGHRPKWLEREARRRLDDVSVDPPSPANDNRTDDARLRELFGDGQMGVDQNTGKHFLANCKHEGKVGVAEIGPDGQPRFKAYATQPRPVIKATPFALRDPSSLPARDWLFARHYIRKFLTSTVGAGGGGKSAHSISETLAMVTGRPLLDPEGPLTKPLRVWYINAEDPQEEIDRRFHAAAKHFDVTPDQIADRLYTDSGRDQEFVIMRQEGRDLKICQPLIDEMVSEIRRREIDVVIVDPLVSTHEVPENDNGAMQRVAKAWLEVSDRGNCCVEVIHHVVKNSGEVTADSARGGGALKDKTRGMRVINAMTREEADKAGLDTPDGYFRIDNGKVNLVASGRSEWRRFANVPLMNGSGLLDRGDEIGVVEAWRWPAAADAVAGVSEEALHAIKRKINGSDCRDNVQSSQWAGYKVAEALQMNMADPSEKKEVRRMLEAWKRQGHFTIEQRPDYKGVERPCLVPVFHTSSD